LEGSQDRRVYQWSSLLKVCTYFLADYGSEGDEGMHCLCQNGARRPRKGEKLCGFGRGSLGGLGGVPAMRWEILGGGELEGLGDYFVRIRGVLTMRRMHEIALGPISGVPSTNKLGYRGKGVVRLESLYLN